MEALVTRLGDEYRESSSLSSANSLHSPKNQSPAVGDRSALAGWCSELPLYCNVPVRCTIER